MHGYFRYYYIHSERKRFFGRDTIILTLVYCKSRGHIFEITLAAAKFGSEEYLVMLLAVVLFLFTKYCECKLVIVNTPLASLRLLCMYCLVLKQPAVQFCSDHSAYIALTTGYLRHDILPCRYLCMKYIICGIQLILLSQYYVILFCVCPRFFPLAC